MTQKNCGEHRLTQKGVVRMTEMKKTVLKIGGMSCASCSSRVEKKLNEMDGVDKAIVNLATERSHIDYDGAIIGTEKIVEAVNNLGYEAKVEDKKKV